MRVIGIYKITSPSGKVYIGQSKNILRRFLYYKNYQCKNQTKLYNSLIKHKPCNHTFEIITECLDSKLNDLEIFYIKFYNSVSNGLNIKHGGTYGRLTEESIKKMKQSMNTEVYKNKMRSIHKNKIVSEETKDKMKDAWKRRKPLSEEVRNRIAEGNRERNKLRIYKKGYNLTESHKTKISNARKV